MKVSKFLVLLGGALGIIAFFLPLLSIHRADYDGTVSGYQLVHGIHVAQPVTYSRVTFADPTGIDAIRGVSVALFVPALLLAVIGALGLVRRTFGRVAGTVSLVLGLVGLAIAAILVTVVDGDCGIALELLLLASIAGFTGGMLAILSPEGRLATAYQP